jgi:glyoxylase-like metal-dependent hydrolase (beta-lactamase superfamily II)
LKFKARLALQPSDKERRSLSEIVSREAATAHLVSSEAQMAPEQREATKHFIPLGGFNEIAPGVAYKTSAIVNLQTIDVPEQDSWVLVDTGLSFSAPWILRAAAMRTKSRPSCIVLTHGHFDHAGAVEHLAEIWDVPVYAHPLEAPYLNGKSKYPPFDPTVGGLMSQMARFFPRSPYHLGERLRELPSNGELDELPGWYIVHTPGHTPGHVSLFREHDAVLIAGDAFCTVDQQSLPKTIVQYREFAIPPAYATTDWQAARQSVQKLADLRPSVVIAGHGQPITGRDTADRLEQFAREFPMPKGGRYVRQPAIADETGVVKLPPPVPDRVPKIAAGVAIAGAAAATAYLLKRRKAA